MMTSFCFIYIFFLYILFLFVVSFLLNHLFTNWRTKNWSDNKSYGVRSSRLECKKYRERLTRESTFTWRNQEPEWIDGSVRTHFYNIFLLSRTGSQQRWYAPCTTITDTTGVFKQRLPPLSPYENRVLHSRYDDNAKFVCLFACVYSELVVVVFTILQIVSSPLDMYKVEYVVRSTKRETR